MLYTISAQNYYRIANSVYLISATDTILGATRSYKNKSKGERK
jgi:hypothetical protein